MNLICPNCNNEYSVPDGIMKTDVIKSFKCYKCEYSAEKTSFHSLSEKKQHKPNKQNEEFEQKHEHEHEQKAEALPVQNISFNQETDISNSSDVTKKLAILLGGLALIAALIYFTIIK